MSFTVQLNQQLKQAEHAQPSETLALGALLHDVAKPSKNRVVEWTLARYYPLQPITM